MPTPSQRLENLIHQLSDLTRKHMKLNTGKSQCEAFVHTTLSMQLIRIERGLRGFCEYHQYVENPNTQDCLGLRHEIAEAKEVAYTINKAIAAVPLTPCTTSQLPKKLALDFHAAVLDTRNALVGMHQVLTSIIEGDESYLSLQTTATAIVRPPVTGVVPA